MSNIFNPRGKNDIQLRMATSITDELAHINTAVVDESVITKDLYSDRVFTYDAYGDLVHMVAGTGIPSNLHIAKLYCDPNDLLNTDMLTTIDEHGVTVASNTGSTIISSTDIKITNETNETYVLDNSRIQYLDSFAQIAEILPSQIKFNRDVATTVTSIDTLHDKSIYLEGTQNDIIDDITELNTKLYGANKSIVVGDGNPLKIKPNGYFAAFSNNKNITSCSGSGLFIDMDPTARTMALNNTVMAGYNNTTLSDPADSACYGIGNSVSKTGVFLGLNNTATRGGNETRYSVLVGSNNQTNNRSFIFGRDNSNTGDRAGGFTTPIMVMGSGNVFSCPKDPCLVLGYDTVDTSQNVDGLSGCIVVGGGNRTYQPYCAYYGKANSTVRTYMEGIAGGGENLCINASTNEVTRKNAITIYKDDYTDSKTLSYDYVHAIEQNSAEAFNNINNNIHYVRYNLVYDTVTQSFGKSLSPIIYNCSKWVQEQINWADISTLPLNPSKDQPINCGPFGNMIHIKGEYNAATASIPTNGTWYFTIAVGGTVDLYASRSIPCYKLSTNINAYSFMSGGVVPKYVANISEPLRMTTSGGGTLYMYVITLQNIGSVPLDPKLVNYSLEAYTFSNYDDSGQTSRLTASTISPYR